MGSRRASAGEKLSQYMRDIGKFPLLSSETELSLCRRWIDHHDISAAHQLASSHLRLVAKIAMSYRGYGLPFEELIGEAHVGLMRAVCRFDPDRGARFTTYAVWWVRAAIQRYILHNWSLVKMGTTRSQKRLFFNLRRMRSKLREFDDGALKSEQAKRIADMLQVSEREVISMNQRMAGPDWSLNTPLSADGQNEWQAQLVDGSQDQETALAEREEAAHWKSQLPSALRQLTMRERHIIVERHLRETPTTVEDLSRHYGVSRERVRQIEARAMVKLRCLVLAARNCGRSEAPIFENA